MHFVVAHLLSVQFFLAMFCSTGEQQQTLVVKQNISSFTRCIYGRWTQETRMVMDECSIDDFIVQLINFPRHTAFTKHAHNMSIQYNCLSPVVQIPLYFNFTYIWGQCSRCGVLWPVGLKIEIQKIREIHQNLLNPVPINRNPSFGMKSTSMERKLIIIIQRRCKPPHWSKAAWNSVYTLKMHAFVRSQ